MNNCVPIIVTFWGYKFYDCHSKEVISLEHILLLQLHASLSLRVSTLPSADVSHD